MLMGFGCGNCPLQNVYVIFVKIMLMGVLIRVWKLSAPKYICYNCKDNVDCLLQLYVVFVLIMLICNHYAVLIVFYLNIY